MNTVDLLLPLMFLSHCGAVAGFVRSLRAGVFPKSAFVAPASFILYYDLGILAELLGYTYDVAWFPALRQAEESTQIGALVILLFAPWLILLGARIVDGRGTLLSEPLASLLPRRRITFYVLTGALVCGLALQGYWRLQSGAAVWELRRQVGEEFGFLAVLLYLPFHVIAFYSTTSDARTKLGGAFLLALVLGSAVTTLSIGQRSTLLLPVMVVLCFRLRPTWPKLLVAGCLLPLVAGAMLSVFKEQFAGSSMSTDELLVKTVQTDFARSGTLLTALELSEPWGTTLLPYTGAGYVYCLLYAAPRSVFEFKGYSTGHEFTARLLGQHAHELTWNLAIGMVEDILLNFGTILCLPVLFIYGVVLGYTDRLATRVPALRVPSRLGALFLCGYDLSSFIFWYGTMALTGTLLHWCFVAGFSARATSAEPAWRSQSGPARSPLGVRSIPVCARSSA